MPKYCNETKVILSNYYLNVLILFFILLVSLLIQIIWLKLFIIVAELFVLYQYAKVIRRIKKDDPCNELEALFRQAYRDVLYYKPETERELSLQLQGIFEELNDKRLGEGISFIEVTEYIQKCKKICEFVEGMDEPTW